MADTITSWMNNAGRYPLLPKSEIIRLAKKRDRYEPGSKQYIRIVNKLCLHNLRLVINTVRLYLNRRQNAKAYVDLTPDLYQMGYIGLRRGAEKFDASRGYTFATYVTPWIHQAVYRGTQRLEHMIYIPENVLTEVLYIKKNGKRSKSKNGKIGDRYIDVARHAMSVASTDIPLEDSNGDSATIVDFCSEENQVRAYSESTDRRKELATLLTEAGLSSKDINLTLEYLRRGNLVSVGMKHKVPTQHVRDAYARAVAGLEALAAS